MVILLPEASRALNSALRVPETTLEWTKQVLIFGLYGTPVRLSPSTWSLNVELFFYLLIGLVTCRSEKGTYIALALSLIPGILALFRFYPSPFCHILNCSFTYSDFYGDPFGCAFVFFLGSAAYFISRRISLARWVPLAALPVYAILGYVAPRFFTDPICVDGLLVISALMVCLILIKLPVVQTQSALLVAIFNFLGRVSYPIFLIHWASSVWLFSLIGWQNPQLFLGGFASTLAISSIMVLVVDRPVELIRNQIRKPRLLP